MKNFKTYSKFISEGKAVDKVKQQEEDFDASGEEDGAAIADILIITDVDENYDTEQRKEMAAKGFALADGSFPIANLEDLKNAIMAYGRAKDQAKAAKFIVKRAKALGAEDLIPDSDDFQKSLKEGIEDVYTQVPAKTIAIEEGKDIGSWNQGGLKGDKNVLVTTFVGPKDIEDFGLGRKCMQINVGMDYISLNPADITELKDILKSYKVK